MKTTLLLLAFAISWPSLFRPVPPSLVIEAANEELPKLLEIRLKLTLAKSAPGKWFRLRNVTSSDSELVGSYVLQTNTNWQAFVDLDSDRIEVMWQPTKEGG